MKIAHVVNPVNAPPTSDLVVAQPVTFETMRRARALASGSVEVDLFTAQYPEDHDVLPSDFERLPDMERSVIDLASFQRPRKLPILRDILDGLYRASDAEYFIYTNVDIAVMPQFYLSVAALLQESDGLVINRRTISDRFQRVEEIPLMWAELGHKHGGFDCFVFRRDAYPRYQLADVCIGAKGIGVSAYANVVAFANRFALLKDAHLTFHIGNDMKWTSSTLDDYMEFNFRQVNAGARRLRLEAGPLDESTAVGRFLLDRYHRARHYYLKETLLLDNSEEALKPKVPSARVRARKYLGTLKRRLIS